MEEDGKRTEIEMLKMMTKQIRAILVQGMTALWTLAGLDQIAEDEKIVRGIIKGRKKKREEDIRDKDNESEGDKDKEDDESESEGEANIEDTEEEKRNHEVEDMDTSEECEWMWPGDGRRVLSDEERERKYDD